MTYANGHRSSSDREAQCEVLFELYEGDSSVHVGRLLKGHDAGRLVSLRHVKAALLADLAHRVDLARSIAHPRLTKVLGIVSAGGNSYLASEYVPGVTLPELRRAVLARKSPLDLAAAIRIVVDALQAAEVGQLLLLRAAGEPPGHHLYVDHIHVAAYGETLLTEVGVAPYLRPAPARRWQDDLRTAAQEFCWLAAASDGLESLADQQRIPKALYPVLHRALTTGLATFANTASFVAELVAQSDTPLASEEVVSGELMRLVGGTLKKRQRKLEMFERGAAQQDSEESTQFFRAAQFAGSDSRDTARPPADRASVSVPISARLVALHAMSGDDEDDDQTQLWHSVTTPADHHDSGPAAGLAERSSGTPPPVELANAAKPPVAPNADEDTPLSLFRAHNTAAWLLAIALVLSGLALLASHFGF